MRMLSGRPEEMNSDANFLMESLELMSTSMISILAVGISLSISSLTFVPETTFLTATITCTPRNANTLAVSTPMPLDAPVTITKNFF